MNRPLATSKGAVDKNILLKSSLVLFILAGGVSGFFNWKFFTENTNLKNKIVDLQKTVTKSQNDLQKLKDENNNLSTALISAEEKTSTYSNKLDEITYTVDTLQRLTKTDPQLLYKYSKIFFLNENYSPSLLTPIDTKYLFNKDKPLQIHDSVWPFLNKLLSDAKQNGVDLEIISAFRSFGTQAILKSSYKMIYGKGTANAFSADQGYSEHQLGTTIDLTTAKVGSTFSGFDKTDSFAWLRDNAYKYGFILSYPKSNTFYTYEPWHWRFVGLDLALLLHNENKYFYDLDQRDINNYLVNIFSATTTLKK